MENIKTVGELKLFLANISDDATLETALKTYTQTYPVAYVPDLFVQNFNSLHHGEKDSVRFYLHLPEGYSVANRNRK